MIERGSPTRIGALFAGILLAVVTAFVVLAASLPTPARPQTGPVRWVSVVASGPAFNCAGATCDVALPDLSTTGVVTCYVSHTAGAARNVSFSMLRGDGTVLWTSATSACATAVPCAVTIGTEAPTVAFANNLASWTIAPTRSAKLTVAAGGTTGTAFVTCVGR